MSAMPAIPRQQDVGLALTYYQSYWAQPAGEAIKMVKRVNLIVGFTRASIENSNIYIYIYIYDPVSPGPPSK